MSYRVTSSHVEPLHDGRMVGPGDPVSDADAKKNPRLVERGALTKEPEQHKARADKSDADPKVEPKPAAQEKEESK